MISISNLSVCYPDGTRAVDGLDLNLNDGENVALIGANGAGKTSFLLSLVGVLPIASGTVTVDGVELNKKTINDIRKRVGLVFQNPDDQLFMPIIREDVAFGPHNFGKSHDEIDKLVQDTLALLGISHLAERSPLKLSGGEKRMAAIATVLSMEPSAMLFDEPTAFLDPRARRNLINVLDKLPHTKLIATHDLSFALETCSRAVLLKKGKLFADGDPKELLFDEKLMEDCGIEAIKWQR